MSQREELNQKALYLIDGACLPANITPEDIYNAYTGCGGLHKLNRSDYDSYHEYSMDKKDFENGQFFTPPALCELLVSCLKLSESDLIADLTCGMGNFFNHMPIEANTYGCEIDIKAFKVCQFLYPDTNLELKDIRTYQPDIRFDYIVGNPPFNLKWWIDDDGEVLSQLYYCQKSAMLLKPLGILALIVPRSFLADKFTDGAMITEMETHFSFLGQVNLPEDAFSSLGIQSFPTKLQFWQKKSELAGWSAHPYQTDFAFTLSTIDFDIALAAEAIYKRLLQFAKAALAENQSHIMLELARQRNVSQEFQYQTQKLLYQIKAHPATRSRYSKCCEYLYRYYTETQPEDMLYSEWVKVRLTENKVLSYLRRSLKKQNKRPDKDVVRLVKQPGGFVYKGYSAKARRQLTEAMQQPVPVYQAVLEHSPDEFPGYRRLLRRKQAAYELQNQPFSEMKEDAAVAKWLSEFVLWDAENEETIRLNDAQKRDLNLVLQKNYALLQWEQGSGKTLAGIATGLYHLQHQQLHSIWVVSSAISIRNNWDVVLKNYNLPYTFVEKLENLEQIQPGHLVLITLNKVSQYKRQLRHWMKIHRNKIQLILDESDEISNASSIRTKAMLSCFRRCRAKLLMTGTSTRNNISEFAPQLELLYNNSINMISWCTTIYRVDRKAGDELQQQNNPNYGQPIPAYKKGYALFSASHLPEKITVFGVGQRTQDIYNATVLSDILDKTVITRTFEEISGKHIKRIHQVPLRFCQEEKAVYQKAINEFLSMRNNYFSSSGNSRKDSMMRLIQQITLLLRISAAPDTVAEYTGDIPIKILSVIELAAQWEDQVIAVGVRHKVVLDSYAKAFKEFFPERPLFIVTGSTTTFAKRRVLRKTLLESNNGILLCTQQSLPSSVNFEFVNKIIIPELHYNNAAMSQFYFRFIRYTSTEYKDIYFVTYAGSIESNLMQMVLTKEKLNLFMKGQDVDLDSIYQKFDVNYDLMSMLMYQEQDENGVFHIRWGEQNIA